MTHPNDPRLDPRLPDAREDFGDTFRGTPDRWLKRVSGKPRELATSEAVRKELEFYATGQWFDGVSG